MLNPVSVNDRYMVNILEIADPFRYEPGRYGHIAHAEEIFHLGGKYRKRDAACESYDYRIWYEFEYRTHLAQTHDDKYDSCHDGGKGEPLNAVLGDNSGNDYDECPCRTSYKESGTSENGDEKSGHYGGYKSLLR